MPRAGFLSPASRGALLTALLVMYLLLALAAGFASVWLWGLIQARRTPPQTQSKFLLSPCLCCVQLVMVCASCMLPLQAVAITMAPCQ